MKTAIELIAEERQRQIEKEGYTSKNDDLYKDGELSRAAAAYAIAEIFRRQTPPDYDKPPHMWPWNELYWKPTPDDRIRELTKAGALIVAAIQQEQRLNQKEDDK